MRRVLIVGTPVAVSVPAVRARLPRLHARLMARCEAMFERMPDAFPPKMMMRGVEEVPVQRARILELLEVGEPEGSGAFSDKAVHHAA